MGFLALFHPGHHHQNLVETLLHAPQLPWAVLALVVVGLLVRRSLRS